MNDLLVFVHNLKAKKLWEVVLFTEFLEEKAGLDELFFFLHCRFLLLKGPQLALYSA